MIFRGNNKPIYLSVLSFLAIGIGFALRLLNGCSRNLSTISLNGIAIKVKDYSLQRLDYESLPQGYTGRSTISVEDPGEIAELPTLTYKGQKGYHPVRIARLLLALLNSYKVTSEQAYLEKAKVISDKYVDTATESTGAMYFPYTFDFHLHGIQKELMEAPWYSGMAQRISLSAYVRFYQVTGEQKYLGIVNKVFKSFTNLRNNEHNPWIAYVDDNGYYWIEEYPIWPPAHTLNGFLYAIFGLYEYWLLKQDVESETVLKAAITTIQHYLSQYRNPGELSFYCLKHKVQNLAYHKIHINQLYELYLICQDEYFHEMMYAFQRDLLIYQERLEAGEPK
jgi:hypothetical protein